MPNDEATLRQTNGRGQASRLCPSMALPGFIDMIEFSLLTIKHQ
jgi:hypothetical protein